MPIADEVHFRDDSISAGPALPPTNLAVAVPVTTAGTVADSSVGKALFGGEEYFYAKCSKSDLVGSAVYANTTIQFVSTADASKPFPVVGFIVAKSSDTDCTVQRYGESSISFRGLQASKRYFLAAQGGITTPPFPNNSVEFVQQIGSAVSDTTLFIQPTGTVVRRDLGGEVVTSSTLLNGQGVPPGTLGKDNDFYIDVISNMIYGPKAANAWGEGTSLVGPPGRAGNVGPQGEPGAASVVPGPPGKDGIGRDGIDGYNGKDGNTVLADAGHPPDNVGKVGDFYYDTVAFEFFGPKLASGWPLGGTSLIGPRGDVGLTGPRGESGLNGIDGTDGAATLAGYGPPGDALGKDGDTYFNQQNGTIYGPKADGAWPTDGTSLVGPAGEGGQAGTKILAADGPPDETQGEPGDYYFDTSTRTLYGPKSA